MTGYQDPGGWDPATAESWMVAAERCATNRSGNVGELRPGDWADMFVANLEERDALKLWIWCKARRESFREICLNRGRPYSTLFERKSRALSTVAMMLNLEERYKRHGPLVPGRGARDAIFG